jgi:hypothetical protein
MDRKSFHPLMLHKRLQVLVVNPAIVIEKVTQSRLRVNISENDEFSMQLVG